MATTLNKGKFTVGGSNSKLGGESNHSIRAGKVYGKLNTKPSNSFGGHGNKPRDLGMSITTPLYGTSARDGLGGKVKPFQGKMGGFTASAFAKNNNPLAKVKK